MKSNKQPVRLEVLPLDEAGTTLHTSHAVNHHNLRTGQDQILVCATELRAVGLSNRAGRML